MYVEKEREREREREKFARRWRRRLAGSKTRRRGRKETAMLIEA
jgi:hypothetical protein